MNDKKRDNLISNHSALLKSEVVLNSVKVITFWSLTVTVQQSHISLNLTKNV